MLDGITLVADVLSSHVEDHGGTAAVLNSCVATELDEIGVAHHCSDVVAFSLDLLDLLDAEAKLGALSDGELVLEGKSAGSASTVTIKYIFVSVSSLCIQACRVGILTWAFHWHP